MTSPVARLFESLANALLGLGLPTIREWLRDRMGPLADVEHISTDAGLVHLDGVRVPFGPRGLLVLERASAVITTLGSAGLPELRLHSFTGVLGFGDAAHGFRAEVAFSESAEPEDAAWIWGELAIRNVAWTTREGSVAGKPMNGRARLFVSSREWRLDGGRLEGEVFRGQFAGSGSFEEGTLGEEAPIVPPALSAAALSLENGHVGPFADAISGLIGKKIAIPSFVPLDAELEGNLSWRIEGGGSVDLRLASAALDATIQGAVGPTGRALGGLVDARGRPALLLRGSGVPPAARPREEDSLHVVLDVSGELRRPEVKGTLHASEIGFRLGRARFVPPVTLDDLQGEVFLKDGRAVLHAIAKARSAPVTLDVDALVRDPASTRGTLRVAAFGAAFLRDVVRTLGVKLLVPEDVAFSADFTLAPGNVLSGSATLATATSKLALDVSSEGRRSVTGNVTVTDIVATGLFNAAVVVPAEGDLALALAVVTSNGAVGLSGTLTSPRIVLAIGDGAESVSYVVEEATARVGIGGGALSYEDLRFRAHGGRFKARGKVPFAPDRSSVLLELELESGGAEVAEALARLGRNVGFYVRVARDEPRPTDERWLPRDLVGHGTLALRGDGVLRADVTLGTTAGTALELGLRRAHARLDGTTLVGRLALTDAMTSGFLGGGFDVSGSAAIDVLVARTTESGPVMLASVSSTELTVTYAGSPFVVKSASALLRADASALMWNRIEAELCGGAVRSSGAYASTRRLSARVSFSQVAMHELPAIAGRQPATLVRGFLSGSIIGRLDERLDLAGDVMLDEAAFPALDLVRPTLARYGLRPPNEDAVRPVTATIAGTEWGTTVRDVNVELHGVVVQGELGISQAKNLDGHVEVVLDEEYLRTSKALTLPRVLSDRIVVPVRIDGPLERPRVHASLGESLGRFLKDNRVSAFVTSAVEEAQILLGREPLREPEAEHANVRPSREAELDARLRGALDEHFADWELLRARSARA